RQAFLLLLALTLTACITAGTPPDMKTVKTVGVISAISEKLYVRKVGIVAFLNDKKDFPIESWGINDMVAGKVRSALSRRYDVRPLTYRKSAFASLESGQSTLAERIRAEVTPQGLDAYLVVVSGDAQYLGSNQQLYSF